MLFNSYLFIFCFLPVALCVFYLLGARGKRQLAIAWLVGMSLFFYGWWNPIYLFLMAASILFNYSVGTYLSSKRPMNSRKLLLWLGIVCNISLLGYFKYANFFVENLNHLLGNSYNLERIVLPLAISFFTFQQIAYLMDAYRGETKEYNFLHYCLFVTFFPQLIAGPIVHHKEMLPQFGRDALYKFDSTNFAVGSTIFIVGLFKKVVLADSIAAYATPVFQAAGEGVPVTFFAAWVGTLSYTLQLYFDFSGYSDMAIGLGRMFGVRLPLNFHSPYRSTSIIEFWRRWHMTLSRFLRDYLYIPLGGSRKGRARRYVNLMLTMLLGGLWHGAGWGFVFWGALHGFYLVVNHLFRFAFAGRSAGAFGAPLAWGATFLAVVFAWVPFRAETVVGTKTIWLGMCGANGVSLPAGLEERLGSHGAWLVYEGLLQGVGIETSPSVAMAWIVGLLVIALVLPNTQQFMRHYHPAFETYPEELAADSIATRLQWRPSALNCALVSVMLILSILCLSQVSEFLYFQF